MKAVFITDIHISGKNPLCRTDDLVEVQFKKLFDIVVLSNLMKIPIICGGDVTEQPNISYSVFTKIAKILSKCKYGFYTIFGNHDLQYHSIEGWGATALGALIISIPTIRHISSFLDDYSIPIDYIDWDSPIQYGYGNNANILLSHKAVVPEKEKEFWQEANKDDFIDENDKFLKKYKLVLCGHYHKQYNTKKIINPGCFTRRKANEIEMAHIPSYSLIDFDTYSFEIHALPNVKPSEEVISTLHLQNNFDNKTKENILNFINSIKGNINEVNDLLNSLVKLMNTLDYNIKEELREILIKLYGDKIEYILLSKEDENGFKENTKFKRKIRSNKK